MPTAKNGLQILNLHPKKYIFREKNTPIFNANLLEKFQKEYYNNIPTATNTTIITTVSSA